jgi:hypothetical protein
MSVANVAQAIGIMHEQVRPELPRLYQQDYTAWGRIKSRTDIVVVSSRPTRVPLRLLAGGKFRVGSPDGQDIGLGSSFTTDAMTLVPVYFFQASQYTKATEINTNSDEKAIEDYAMLTMKDAMEQFNVCMESVLQGDGSNTLDTIVSLSNGNTTLTVNNANWFVDNQDIDIWSALGGYFLGTVTILSVDGPNNQINLTAAVPGGAVAGSLLLVSGSAGVANSGLFGIKYWQVSSNTGSVGNLARAAYPGKLTTPHVSGNNQALTPAKARIFQAQMQAAMGIEAAEKSELEFQMNTDMSAAWENVGLLVSQVIQNQVKGENSVDMLKKDVPQTFAGRPVLKSIHATPGRIDGLAFKHWFRCENQPIDYYEVGGQTLFPTYGASGGLSTSTLFYLWTGVQIGNANVRGGVYGDGFAIPKGYFNS